MIEYIVNIDSLDLVYNRFFLLPNCVDMYFVFLEGDGPAPPCFVASSKTMQPRTGGTSSRRRSKRKVMPILINFSCIQRIGEVLGEGEVG